MTTTVPQTVTPLMAFAALLRAHDFTYHYSDDPAVWRKGHQEWLDLVKAGAGLERGEVMALVELRANRYAASRAESVAWQQRFEAALDAEVGR